MSTPLANPRRTKLNTWPKRHEDVPERDQAAPADSTKSAMSAEKQGVGK